MNARFKFLFAISIASLATAIYVNSVWADQLCDGCKCQGTASCGGCKQGFEKDDCTSILGFYYQVPITAEHFTCEGAQPEDLCLTKDCLICYTVKKGADTYDSSACANKVGTAGGDRYVFAVGGCDPNWTP